MRTLIYKRTHRGDPDREGRFGIRGCMGRVRTWHFEAVIGVGDIGAEPKAEGLDRKVNWIGIGPRRMGAIDKRGYPVVTFDHFLLFGPEGGSRAPEQSFRELAPRLEARVYSKNVRVLMDRLDAGERAEIETILALAKNAPPSSADGAGPGTTSNACVPRTRSAKSIKGCSS